MKTPQEIKDQLPKPEPALYRHACKLYDIMASTATEETVQGNSYQVYRGYLSKAYAQTNISQQYYPAIFELLENYACIAVLAKGARNSPAVVVMLQHPKDAAIPADGKIFRRGGRSPLTAPQDYARLSQRVENLSRALAREDRVTVLEALKNLDERISRLEAE